MTPKQRQMANQLACQHNYTEFDDSWNCDKCNRTIIKRTLAEAIAELEKMNVRVSELWWVGDGKQISLLSYLNNENNKLTDRWE